MLRAIFAPLEGSGDWDVRRSDAARHAWVLLGGTDWFRLRVLTPTLTLTLTPTPIPTLTPALALTRFRLRVLEEDEPADDAAPGSPSSVAAKEETLLPAALRGGRAPRRAGFIEASEMRLRDFRTLVTLFGDYWRDRELWNCQAEIPPTYYLA